MGPCIFCLFFLFHSFIRLNRYASLYFVTFVDRDDNELLALEIIHQYVEVLDRYFGNVCGCELFVCAFCIYQCELMSADDYDDYLLLL